MILFTICYILKIHKKWHTMNKKQKNGITMILLASVFGGFQDSAVCNDIQSCASERFPATAKFIFIIEMIFYIICTLHLLCLMKRLLCQNKESEGQLSGIPGLKTSGISGANPFPRRKWEFRIYVLQYGNAGNCYYSKNIFRESGIGHLPISPPSLPQNHFEFLPQLYTQHT